MYKRQALSFLLKCKVTNARLLRWILAIGEYSFTIKYCKGKDNIIADTLSRYVTEKCEEVYEKNHNVLQLLPIKFTIDNDIKHMLKNLAQQQNLDDATREFKLRDHLPDNYKVQNGVCLLYTSRCV